ncbi:MAG: flagellar basal-body rod protein FlgF [Halanaerobiales bacterium]|nr:flagellar basal-body rod protein FlgF [Halanaerobiales bacterium]
MLKGLYIASSSMLAKQHQLAIISNNLANASTAGFKRDEGIEQSFPEVLISRIEEGRKAGDIGSMSTGVSLEETYTDFRQGYLKHTGNKLDVALEGDGFFVIETPAGLRYTRNGNFTLNQQGQIVTQQGYPVRGERGPLQTITGREIKIDGNGRLHLGNLRGDRFLIVDFPDKSQLEKIGDNLYSSRTAGEQLTAGYRLRQGYLESSNVKTLQEMVRMIEVNRIFEANQKVIKSLDSTLDKAVNSVGRVG